jgi:hypothetical protein
MICLQKNIFTLFIIVTLSLLAGCSKTTIDEIPSYIAIDTTSINVASLQGTASQKISDTWVYADNELIGAFEVPAQFPVLKNGSSELSIFAGIRLNGINETRAPYPFYEKITRTVNLEREKITDLGHLKFSYVVGTKFAWQEDFEQANLSIDSTARSEVNLVRTRMTSELAAAFPFEMNEWAAKIVIPDDSLVFECASHDSYKLPTTGTSVFLEMNYKSNNSFTVGLIVNGSVTSQKSVLVINPSETWNKIYINLTPSVSASSGATSFKVFLSAMKNTNVPKAEIYFDNFKLLHF